jgi:hypothetical protein
MTLAKKKKKPLFLKLIPVLKGVRDKIWLVKNSS